MKTRKKFIPYLFIFLLSLFGFFLFINTFEPSKAIDLFGLPIHPEVPFFLLMLVGISCLGAFAFMNSRRGLLCGAFITTVAILQYFKVNNFFYIAILVTIIILIEFFFWKKKEPK